MHNLIVSSYNLFLHSYRYGVENHIYCIKKQFQDEKILEVSGRKVGYLPLKKWFSGNSQINLYTCKIDSPHSVFSLSNSST